MKNRGRFDTWRIVAVTLMALLLAACAGASEPEPVEVTSTYQLEVQKAFEGYEPRDASEMDAFVEEAKELAKERRKAVGEKSEEQELITETKSTFAAANDAYRAGDYGTAVEGYKDVLKTYALHLGANVNLTLALLQQGEAEEALSQALACASLFSEDGGTLINVQVAGVACGFSNEAIADAIGQVCDVSDPTSLLTTDELRSYWDYNNLWSRIETDLYASAQDTSGDAYAEGAETYEGLSQEFDDLEATLSDDDEAALRAYLYTVGLQLGYEVNPSFVEPAKGFPYRVIDDEELCTLVIDSYVENDSSWNAVVSYRLTNNSDKIIAVEAASTWQVNGQESGVMFNGVSADLGETAEETFSLMAGDGLESFSGAVVIRSTFDGSVLGLYPLAWEAADEG